jgi:hypothetical protein
MKNSMLRAGMLAAVATAGLLAAAAGTPAQAGVPTTGSALTRAAAPAAPNINQGRATKSVVTLGAKATRPIAGSACFTSWVQVTEKNIVGISLAWYRLTTNWCHNRTIVTRHSTVPTGGVTRFGGALGWDFLGQISHGANCYVAAGSRRMCSGVHEVSEGKFQFCPPRIVCVQKWFPVLQEWENYRGQFLHRP